jgi:hypothetical protein
MISNFFRLIHNDVPYDLFQRIEYKEKSPPKYYDRVYLCIEDLRPTGAANVSSPIKGFLCKKFDDFEFADEYLQKFPNKHDIRSTMIPICKWSPAFLDSFILNSRLRKIFWLGKHSFVRSDGSPPLQK